MNKKTIKVKVTTLLALTIFVLAFMLMPQLGNPTEAAEIKSNSASKVIQYGTNGYRCNQENAKSGMLLIGDSRVCQLWKTNKSGASFVSVWGGHYYGGTNAMSIDNNNNRRMMKKYIAKTLKKKTTCQVYIFATVNDFNGGTDAQAKAAADKVIALAKSLQANRVKITIVELVGEKGKNVSNYNKYLKKHLPEKVQLMSMKNCLKGANKGYSNDNLHYNTKTLRKIWKKLK